MTEAASGPVSAALETLGAPARHRVLVIAPEPFYSDRGTPIATRHLLEALSELGYETDVLTYPTGRPLDIPGVRYFRLPNPLRLKVVPIGFSLRKCWLDLFLFPALSRRLRESDYSCIHALEESAFVAALVAGRTGVPVIYDMQSSLAEQMISITPFRNPIARGLVARCERWLFEHVDLIMTSVGLAVRVRKASPTARVREWRYPGIAQEVLPSDVDELREKLAIDSTAPIVLYAGTFQHYQGLSELLEAMPAVLEAVPGAVLLLVGAENGSHDRAVRRLARRLPECAVRVLERQPREAIPRFMALADVVVSPRVYGENLPIKVLEYLAAGRAIVATAIPAHRTLLDDDRALLVEPTADALAAGISSLLLDDERRGDFERKAREYAEKHLDWLGFVHSVGEIFSKLEPDGR
jgi:glycosyltransferase involved in cell wall biosynthesis